MVLMYLRDMVLKCLFEMVLISHVLLIMVCENKNVDTGEWKTTCCGNEVKLYGSNKLLVIAKWLSNTGGIGAKKWEKKSLASSGVLY